MKSPNPAVEWDWLNSYVFTAGGNFNMLGSGHYPGGQPLTFHVRFNMDFLSLAAGFLVGTATGAAGSYFADKYTDVRREKKLAKEQERLWQDIETRFPAVIAEMRSDFSGTEGRNVRVIFIKKSNTVLGFVSEPCFEYHTDKHPDIRPAVLYLAQHGFIADITTGNCPTYRVHEKLVDWLMKPNN